MVKISEIIESNSSLQAGSSGLVAVVVGGTGGIGKAFVKSLAINTNSPKIYIVGRNEQVLDSLKTELTSLNSSGTYIPIPCRDLSLIKEVDAVSRKIKSQEEKIDILYQSQGYVSFGKRDENEEGLDKLASVRYYGKIRFILNFLDQLEAAPSPRVIIVLAAGLEGSIFPDDLGMRNPKNDGFLNAASSTATFVTLSLEKLHQKHPKISFVHLYPGITKTDLFKTEHLGPVAKFILNWVLFPISHLAAYSADEVGQRALYAATNGRFRVQAPSRQASGLPLAEGSDGEVGSGVYTLNQYTDPVHNDKVLKPYRSQGFREKIWEHTIEEFETALAK